MKRPKNKNNNRRPWKELFLKYFDWNKSGTVDWWEWLIPLVGILVIEIIAELIATIIAKGII